MIEIESWSRHLLGLLEVQPQRGDSRLPWTDIALLTILGALILALGIYGPAMVSQSWLSN